MKKKKKKSRYKSQLYKGSRKQYPFLKTLFPKKERRISELTNTKNTVSIYYFPTDDDEEGPTFKEKALALFLRCIDIFCVWDCCSVWLTFQKYVALLVFDPFVELFITLCIVVNTLFMALDHHDMDREMERVLKSGNYVSIQRREGHSTPLPLSLTLSVSLTLYLSSLILPLLYL
jgi:hypothetical protein